MRKMIEKTVLIPAPIDGVPQNCFSEVTLQLIELKTGESVFFPDKKQSYFGPYFSRIRRYKSYRYKTKIMQVNSVHGVMVTRYE